MSKTSARENRLGDEVSPYLLQHAGNPVAWQPWGEAAFAAAAREGKPQERVDLVGWQRLQRLIANEPRAAVGDLRL